MEKTGFQWKSEDVRNTTFGYDAFSHIAQAMRSHFTSLAACLEDAELPVRVQAALALTEMITQHDYGTYM